MTPWRAVQLRLQSLEGAARMFDLLSLEEAEETEARVELGLGIGPLHMEASEILEEIESLAAADAEEVHDLVFGIRVQLAESQAAFQVANSRGNTLDVLAAAGRSVGEVIRAARALDLLAARRGGGGPALERERDTEAALQLRRGFAELGRQIDRDGPPSLPHLRRVTRAITELTERHRRALRLADRIALRRLAERVEQLDDCPAETLDAWLRRLETDMRGVVRLLLGISRREELVEHDRTLARRVRARLVEDGRLRAAEHSALMPLLGRAPRLDELLWAADLPLATDVAAELDAILAAP